MQTLFNIYNNCFNKKVTIEYKIENGVTIPRRVHTIVISAQHSENIKLEEIKKQLYEKVIKVSITYEFTFIAYSSNTLY